MFRLKNYKSFNALGYICIIDIYGHQYDPSYGLLQGRGSTLTKLKSHRMHSLCVGDAGLPGEADSTSLLFSRYCCVVYRVLGLLVLGAFSTLCLQSPAHCVVSRFSGGNFPCTVKPMLLLTWILTIPVFRLQLQKSRHECFRKLDESLRF